MSFGKRLAGMRKEKGLNKSELAAILKVSHVQIINYESDKDVPSLPRLKLIAKYFGVTTDYLLGTQKEDGAKKDWERRGLEKLNSLPLSYKKDVFNYIDLIYHKFSTSK